MAVMLGTSGGTSWASPVYTLADELTIDWIKPTLHGGSMNLADLSINAALIVLVVGGAIEWWLDARSRRAAPPEATPSELAP